MYFLDELTREHQKELLHEAKLARCLKSVDNKDLKVQTRLRNTVGDLLINSGLKLKGQRPIMHRLV